MAEHSLEVARSAKAKALSIFGKLDEFSGVGLTCKNGEYALKVNLESQPSADVEVPEQIDGVPVVLKVVGHIRKQGK